MKKTILLLILHTSLFSCSNETSNNYTPIQKESIRSIDSTEVAVTRADSKEKFKKQLQEELERSVFTKS